jgi:hypothetical protein
VGIDIVDGWYYRQIGAVFFQLTVYFRFSGAGNIEHADYGHCADDHTQSGVKNALFPADYVFKNDLVKFQSRTSCLNQ